MICLIIKFQFVRRFVTCIKHILKLFLYVLTFFVIQRSMDSVLFHYVGFGMVLSLFLQLILCINRIIIRLNTNKFSHFWVRLLMRVRFIKGSWVHSRGFCLLGSMPHADGCTVSTRAFPNRLTSLLNHIAPLPVLFRNFCFRIWTRLFSQKNLLMFLKFVLRFLHRMIIMFFILWINCIKSLRKKHLQLVGLLIKVSSMGEIVPLHIILTIFKQWLGRFNSKQLLARLWIVRSGRQLFWLVRKLLLLIKNRLCLFRWLRFLLNSIKNLKVEFHVFFVVSVIILFYVEFITYVLCIISCKLRPALQLEMNYLVEPPYELDRVVVSSL